MLYSTLASFRNQEPKIQGSGFKAQGSGFGIRGSGEFRIEGSELRVQGSGFRVQGSGFRVSELESRLQYGADFITDERYKDQKQKRRSKAHTPTPIKTALNKIIAQ